MRELAGWVRRASRAGALEECSLVVATYRRPGDVVSLLDRVSGLEEPPAEVVVVDGSPDEATEGALDDWARDSALPFDLLYIDSPSGLTRQRNVGIDASTRELVLFLDDDCHPEPGYFRAVRDVFASDRGGDVGAVGGCPINEMDRPLALRWRVRFFLRLLPRGESGVYYPIASSVPRSMVKPFTGCREVDVLPGCAMTFRRAALDRERFSLFFAGYSQGEDLEMSLRVGRSWRVLWCGDARVIHRFSPGGRPAPVRKGRMEVRNRFFIWKRHTPRPRVRDRIRFWIDIGYVIAYDLVSSLLRPRRFGWHLLRAGGATVGALECFLRPPRYEEPEAVRKYSFALEERGGAAAGVPGAGHPRGDGEAEAAGGARPDDEAETSRMAASVRDPRS